MPRLPTLGLLAPIVAGALSLSTAADAQEFQVGAQQPPQPQMAPPPQGGVVVQQPQYAPPVYQPQPVYQQPAPVYQQPVYPQPVYQQPQPIYVQQQPPPMAPPPSQGPRVIKNWEGGPIPAGYHEESHVRLGLVIGGAVLFGTTYLFTTMGAAISSDAGNPVNALYVPVFGPFIQAGQTSTSTGAFFYALDGLVQAGGVTMFALGIALPKHELVRNDFGVNWSIKPLFGKNQSGMGLVGTF
jgi:hypothetical protein